MSKMPIMLVMLALSVAACDKKKDAAKSIEPEVAVVETAPVEPAEAQADISAERVPLPEDFAAETTAEVTEDNAEAVLAELEAALASEG